MVLKEFEEMSGLQASMEKSVIYTAGISEINKRDLTEAFPFAEGQLPVRYLGLPLLTRRMMKEDYAPLVERIRTRLSSWNMRMLSYAGRAMLIASIIMSLMNFWQAIFPLPSACLEEIQRLCASFLWDGPKLNARRTKTGWNNLCYPKEEGGLGFRLLKDSAKVYILKIIWRLLASKDSLWADWMRSNMIQADSFWNIQQSYNDSWIFKKILKYRELAREFHQMEIVSGTKASFWFDKWSQLGILYENCGARGTMELGVPIIATFKEACLRIRERSHRNEVYRNIQSVAEDIRGSLVMEGDDIHKWKQNEEIFLEKFNTKNTWSMIRQKRQRVDWMENVWFKRATPKYSFIHWMVSLDKIATKDKIKRWNPRVNSLCILCNSEEETRNHLFLECSYSAEVWSCLMKDFMGRNYSTDWEVLSIIWKRYEKDKIRRFLFHYTLQTTIYNIWLERNRRNHGLIGNICK